MGRDIKFEIQYLLALALVVFGMLSINTIRTVVDRRIGLIVILFLSVQLALFNLLYGYGQALDFSIDFVEEMNARSSILLFATTMSFSYFILHWIFSSLHEYFIENYCAVNGTVEIFMDYAIPFFIIAYMGHSFRENVSGPHSRFSDVSIKVFPQEVRVFPTVRDSKPFTVKIENNGEEVFRYDLTVSIPTDMTLHMDDEAFRDSFSSSGEVHPGRASRRTFETTYEGNDRALDEVEVFVNFEGGSKSETISADLIG